MEKLSAVLEPIEKIFKTHCFSLFLKKKKSWIIKQQIKEWNIAPFKNK